MMTRQDLIRRQIQRLTRRMKTIEARSDRIANARMTVLFFGAPAMLVLFFTNLTTLFLAVSAVVILVFGVLVAIHRRLKMTLHQFTLARKLHRGHLARATLNWKHMPPGKLPAEDLHPLETDLDLRKLHRLLDVSVTQSGAQRLRDWLLPLQPRRAEIDQRQARVRELMPLRAFRDQLVLRAQLAAQDRVQNVQALQDWAQQDVDSGRIRAMLMLLGAGALVNIVLMLLSVLDVLPPIWLLTWGVYAAVYITQHRAVGQLFSDTVQLSNTLRRLNAVLSYLETYPFARQPELDALRTPIREGEPSKLLRRIMGTANAASLQTNPYLWLVLNALMPWDLYHLHQLNQQKAVLAQGLPGWLDAWQEFEALSSLANFAYLNPQCSFPVITEDMTYSAQQIGHPLIGHTQRVTNDFAFEQRGETIIITGSNMSGKSSFLRTLGVNLCLAYAGGVVAAQSLEIGLFRLFTSIRVTDSLEDGISYFYAEVKRLRELLDAIRKRDALPVFYMIDEIFKGTNNRERLIGSRSFIHALVGSNGAGLVATHDLELTQLADDDPRIRNLHFRETVTGGRMVFDYVLHAGPCPTTNALTIMALEGLPVDDAEINVPVNISSQS